MDVELRFFDDCPNWRQTYADLAALRADMPEMELSLRIIDTIDDAERFGFLGSPSIVVNGIDLFGDPSAPVGLTCRVYVTTEGPAGSPTVDQLRAALMTAPRSA